MMRSGNPALNDNTFSSSSYKDKPFDLKVLKADVHIYMDSDDELQKADQKVAYLKQVVNYLEQVLVVW